MKSKVKAKVDKLKEKFKWKSLLKMPKGKLIWTILYLIGMFAYSIILFGLSIGAVANILNFKNSNDYAYTQGWK